MVTLLFTDIEGSTRLLHDLGDDYVELLAEHRRIIRTAYGAHGGQEVDTQGDSFFVAFEDGREAILAAAESQITLAAHRWPKNAAVRVRMGLLTGEPIATGEGYVGLDVHRAARISSAAHGGQVLLSHETASLLSGDDDQRIAVRELGPHTLKDLPQPERLFQLVLDGLPNDYPPLRVQREAPAAAGLPDYSLPPADVPLPYKGLAAFGAEDDQLFYGREALVEELLDRLGSRPFLAVVGPSGSGKSSLVLAGLVTRLRPARPHPSASVLAPSEHPLEALVDACSRLAGAQATPLLEGLRNDPEAFNAMLPQRAAGQRTLIVVDQFEEVFTLCDDESERRAFVDALMHAAAPDGRAQVIISLRADFYGHCSPYPNLAAALEHDQALVGPMTEENLRRAIERPAAEVGLSLEPGLVQAVLNDVAGEPGALPLLSHCLVETWKRRSGPLLTLIGYLQSGGVQGAVAKTAEEVTLQLGPQEQRLARSIFLRLSALGEGTEDTRRRVSRGELTQLGRDPGLVEAVLAKLAAARLVTGDEHTVEVAHEALIRHWPRLRAWLDEDRAGHRVHRQLTEAALEWAAIDRDPGALYRGARLEAALEWAAENELDVNELERQFLLASGAAQTEALEQERRRTRRLRALAAGLALLAVAAAVSAGLALRATGRARHQTRVAESQRLAIQAEALAPNDAALSLLVAFQAHALDDSLATRRALLSALTESPQLKRFDTRFAANSSVALAGDRRTLAVGREDGSLRLWNLATGEALTRGIDTGVGFVLHAQFSSDQRVLAIGGDDGARLLDARTLRPLSPVLHETGAVEWLALSPDRRTVGISTSRGWVHLRRVPSGRSLLPPRHVSPERTTGIAFHPDGGELVVGTTEGTALTLDADTGEPRGAPGHVTGRGSTYAVAFSPDGNTLATSDDRGEIVLWDWRTKTRLGKPLRVPDATVYTVAFSPNGRLLAAAGDDGVVAVYNTSSRRRIATLGNHGEFVITTTFTGPHTLLSDSASKLGRWDLDSDVLARWRVENRSRSIKALALSPDGSQLLTVDGGGGLVRRELRAGQRLGPRIRTGLSGLRVMWKPHGQGYVVAGSSGSKRRRRGRVLVWDRTTARPSSSFLTGRTDVLAADLSPDGSSVLLGDQGGRVALWDLGNGRRRGRSLKLDEQRASAVAFSPDGRSFATGGSNGGVSLWRTRDRTKLWSHTTDANVNTIVWAGNGSTLLAASNTTVVRLQASSGKPAGPAIDAAVGEVRALALTADGDRGAVAGQDGTLALINPASGEREFTLGGHVGPINGIAFGDHDKLVISGGGDGRLLARHLDLGWWERQACVLPGRSLTKREARLYLKDMDPASCS